MNLWISFLLIRAYFQLQKPWSKQRITKRTKIEQGDKQKLFVASFDFNNEKNKQQEKDVLKMYTYI